MKRNYKMTVSYDGSRYYGWEHQPDRDTIQGKLEAVLEIMCGEFIDVIGAGRTDAGVHALNQVAHFDIPYHLSNESMRKALNSILPLDILIKKAELVDNDFHARYSAHRKTYRYRVDQGEFVNPFKRNYTSHFKYPLNLEKMRKAANDLVGTHDFTSFVASGSQAKSNVRTIENITIRRDELRNEVVFDFTGNGFLYNQVRIMVAFLLEIGSNQRPVDDVSRVLTAKDRTLARMTAPASGLYLVNVDYGTNDEKD